MFSALATVCTVDCAIEIVLITLHYCPEVNKGTWWIKLLRTRTPLLISTVVMFQAQNRETIKIVLEKVLCPSRTSWRRTWQEYFSQLNTRPARPRPRPIPQCTDFFSSQTGLVLRPTLSDHITGRRIVDATVELPASSQSMLQPRMSESLSTWTLLESIGARDHWCILTVCRSSRGGHWGWTCLPPRNRIDDSGRADYNTSKQAPQCVTCTTLYHVHTRSGS